MIDVKKLKSIKMSMMKMNSTIDKKNKAKYTKSNTATFNIPDNFYEGFDTNKQKEERLGQLLLAIHQDLTTTMNFKEDSIGMWIDYDGKIYENAILMKTLKDMEDYGDKDVNSLYEFFKMTILEA